MFEQKGLCGDGPYAARAEQLCAGHQQMDCQDDEIAHRANGPIATSGARLHRADCITLRIRPSQVVPAVSEPENDTSRGVLLSRDRLEPHRDVDVGVRPERRNDYVKCELVVLAQNSANARPATVSGIRKRDAVLQIDVLVLRITPRLPKQKL